MKIRIDLKIIIFLILFYFTNQISIYLTIMFFSLLHELGHIIIAMILKMKPSKLEIMVFGISVSFKTEINLSEYKNILIACGGPIVSFILVLVYTYLDPIFITKQNAIYSNILILLFNLLPLYPLDGGRIVKGILHIKLGKAKSEIIISKTSEITMIILTIISSISVYCLKNLAIFFGCIFLWFITLQEKNAKTLDILREK